MNFLNSWQWNVVASLVSIVIYFQYYKLAVQNVKKDGHATVALQIIACIAMLFLTPFFPFVLSHDPKIYGMLGVACIFYALNDRLQTTARKNLEVSTFSVLNQLRTVFLVIIGLTIFHNEIIFAQLIGTALIILGTLLLVYKKNILTLDRYALFGILATFFFSIALSVDIGISNQFNLPFYIILILFIPALYLFVAERMNVHELVQTLEPGRLKYYLMAGIAWGFAIFFTLRSYQLGEVVVIASLQATAILFNIIVAYFFGERGGMVQKCVAALIVITGVYLSVV